MQGLRDPGFWTPRQAPCRKQLASADTASLTAGSASSRPGVGVEAHRTVSQKAPATNCQMHPHQAVSAKGLPRLPQLQKPLSCILALSQIEGIGVTAWRRSFGPHTRSFMELLVTTCSHCSWLIKSPPYQDYDFLGCTAQTQHRAQTFSTTFPCYISSNCAYLRFQCSLWMVETVKSFACTIVASNDFQQR